MRQAIEPIRIAHGFSFRVPLQRHVSPVVIDLLGPDTDSDSEDQVPRPFTWTDALANPQPAQAAEEEWAMGLDNDMNDVADDVASTTSASAAFENTSAGYQSA